MAQPFYDIAPSQAAFAITTKRARRSPHLVAVSGQNVALLAGPIVAALDGLRGFAR